MKWVLTLLTKIFKKTKTNLKERENNKMRKLKNLKKREKLESDLEVNTEKPNDIRKKINCK